MHYRQPFSIQGTIGRLDYFVWGALLVAVKYNLDRLLAHIFQRRWFLTDYFNGSGLSEPLLDGHDRLFYFLMLVQSIPFLWMGTVLTVKRLRDANLSRWLVLLFFMPYLNALFFAILSVMPSADDRQKTPARALYKYIPDSKLGSALAAMAITVGLALLLLYLMIDVLGDYSWGIFVGIPFFLGFGSVVLYGAKRDLGFRDASAVAMLSVVFFGIAIFAAAMEGLLCLLMAFPIGFVIAMLGAWVGYAVLRRSQSTELKVYLIPIAVVAVLSTGEHFESPQPQLVSVTTEVTVHAPRQAVWDRLVAFSTIDPPQELLFKTGIAYPMEAVIEGRGVGAVRECRFTTGAFIEPITAWDEPNLLQFSVLDQPPPMVEWSIYDDLHMDHLDGYFRSRRGEFVLRSQPDGTTLLQGTTWYENAMWPAPYWQLWTDYILHQIHYRVLNHIKAQAESTP